MYLYSRLIAFWKNLFEAKRLQQNSTLYFDFEKTQIECNRGIQPVFEYAYVQSIIFAGLFFYTQQ